MSPPPFKMTASTLEYNNVMCSCLYASTCTFILIVTHQTGMTPLHCAAIRGNAEVVNALLKAGSKVDETDKVSMF